MFYCVLLDRINLPWRFVAGEILSCRTTATRLPLLKIICSCWRIGLFPFAGGLHFSGSKAEKDTPSTNTPDIAHVIANFPKLSTYSGLSTFCSLRFIIWSLETTVDSRNLFLSTSLKSLSYERWFFLHCIAALDWNSKFPMWKRGSSIWTLASSFVTITIF